MHLVLKLNNVNNLLLTMHEMAVYSIRCKFQCEGHTKLPQWPYKTPTVVIPKLTIVVLYGIHTLGVNNLALAHVMLYVAT